MDETPSDIYSITVKIDEETLEGLKAARRTLALVRDVEWEGYLQNGNIVLAFKEAEYLSLSQTFTWEEAYQVYATQGAFKDGHPVDEANTELQDIDQGQTATVEQDQSVSVEGDVDKHKPITVINEWEDNARIVLGSKASNGLATQSDPITPFYISPEIDYYTRELTPARSFFVFFASADTVAKIMVDVEAKTVSGHFQFDTETNECVVSYSSQGGDRTMYWSPEEGAEKLTS